MLISTFQYDTQVILRSRWGMFTRLQKWNFLSDMGTTMSGTLNNEIH